MNELYHHGILGQKWGIRRFQNKDGSLTAAGRARYEGEVSKAKEGYKQAKKEAREANGGVLSDGAKKNIKRGAVVAGSALAVYGAYKLSSKYLSRNVNAGNLITQKHYYDNYYDPIDVTKRFNDINVGKASINKVRINTANIKRANIERTEIPRVKINTANIKRTNIPGIKK